MAIPTVLAGAWLYREFLQFLYPLLPSKEHAAERSTAFGASLGCYKSRSCSQQYNLVRSGRKIPKGYKHFFFLNSVFHQYSDNNEKDIYND
jgi:hypothetical protein